MSAFSEAPLTWDYARYLAAKTTVRGYVPHATGGEKLDTVWLEKP